MSGWRHTSGLTQIDVLNIQQKQVIRDNLGSGFMSDGNNGGQDGNNGGQLVPYSNRLPAVLDDDREITRIVKKAIALTPQGRNEIRRSCDLRAMELESAAENHQIRIGTANKISGVGVAITTGSIIAMATTPITIPLMICSGVAIATMIAGFVASHLFQMKQANQKRLAKRFSLAAREIDREPN